MKLNKISWMAALALGGLIASGTVAQAQEKKEVKPEPKPAIKEGSKPTARQDRLTVLSETLKLTDEQKEKLKPILEEETKQVKALREDQSLARDARMAKYKEIREAIHTKVKPLLNAEQLEKWEKMRGMGQPPRPTPPPAPAPAPAAPAPKQ